MNHGSLPFIRLTPMVYQSVQEDHSHYPSYSTLPAAQKPRFHLVIWVRQTHQGRRQQWDMEVLLPLSADIHVLHRLDYTGGFRVHTWQRRRSWGHIRLISSPGFCQWSTSAGGICCTQLSEWQTGIFTIMEFLIELMHNSRPYSRHRGGFGPFSKIT